MVFLCRAVSFVSGKNKNISLVSLLYRAHHGNTVYYSPVEHRNTVDHNNFADIRQTT